MKQRRLGPALGAAVAVPMAIAMAIGCQTKAQDEPPAQPAGWDDAIAFQPRRTSTPTPASSS